MTTAWEKIEKLAAAFKAGDVVTYEEDGLGIVTEARGRGVRVVFASGARSGGSGMVPDLKHREPRANVPIPPGALSNRGWNREQAVSAALRRLDRAMPAAPAPVKLTGAVVEGYRLSGWRRDKHGWYRMWLSIKGPFTAALINAGRVAIPRPSAGKRRAAHATHLVLVPGVADMKARCDRWLTKRIAAYHASTPGST